MKDDWVPLEPLAPEMEDAMEKWFALEDRSPALCLLCGMGFTEAERIPETNFHACAKGLELDARSRREEEARRSPRRRSSAPQQVGIFFVVGGENLFLDSTPVKDASTDGEFIVHAGDHVAMFEVMGAAPSVPMQKFNETPRGRVSFDTRTGKYHLYADACILRDKAMVETIMRDMNLPNNTKLETDPDYRCTGCIRCL